MADAPDFLARVILFQDLDTDALSNLGPLLTPKRLSAGTIVFRELDASDALYIVEQGSVVVSKHVRDDVDIVLTHFRPGDFFGEMGLFDAG
ncbi:MAG: cyclic nucleotide-binding domain-containing protein, partial [Candidatus Binatia bacterium]